MKKRKNSFSRKKKTERRNNIKRYFIISLALVCFLFITFFTYNTYSMWLDTTSQGDKNIVEAGCFKLQIDDLNDNRVSTAINLKNAYPMSEEVGLNTDPYILKITNTCDIPSQYTIILNEFESSSLSNSLIRYQIKKDRDDVPTFLLIDAPKYNLDEAIKNDIELEQGTNINQSYNLKNGYLDAGESVLYELRLWLDYNANNDAMNKRYEAGITVISTSPH